MIRNEKEKPFTEQLKQKSLYSKYWPQLTFLISTLALYTFSQQNSLNTTSSSQSSPSSQHIQYTTAERISINVSDYERLGLTPIEPINLTSISVNDHNHRSKLIHGRFLHITDIHPDEYYKEGSDFETACHRGKPSKDQNNGKGASKYGDATLGCDSPMILMNKTLDWIGDNLRDKIDFVIWTGDNIRHDNDRKYPRMEDHIFEMNGKVADLFHDIFHGDHTNPRHYDVPIVPSLGNNDVYPHNLFSPGPTLQTRELWTIWQSFIPQEQLHIFERGAYYFNEVIPNKLAVLSINTLYLFKSNPLVDSCDNKKDPGYKLFKWLGFTLEEMRSRNMKVWLSGHVPPVPKNYDISCYRKFAIWAHEYRDVIVGGVYGHMNVDHFIPMDAQQAYKSLSDSLLAKGYELDENFNVFMDDPEEISLSLEEVYNRFGFDLENHDLNMAIASNDMNMFGGVPTNKESYLDTVRETIYADVKKAANRGEHSERYAITNVAGSIVPTFNSAMRVWEYNITGLDELLVNTQSQPWDSFFKDLDKKIFEDEDDEEENEYDDEFTIERRRRKNRKDKKPKPDPSLPPKKPEANPLGPGYTPQLFSPTSFVQYYLDLEAINEGKKPFDFEVEYKSTDKELQLKNLLVDDYVNLARDLGKPVKENAEKNSIVIDKKKKKKKKKKNKKEKGEKLQDLWETYLKYAFVSSGYHDIDDE